MAYTQRSYYPHSIIKKPKLQRFPDFPKVTKQRSGKKSQNPNLELAFLTSVFLILQNSSLPWALLGVLFCFNETKLTVRFYKFVLKRNPNNSLQVTEDSVFIVSTFMHQLLLSSNSLSTGIQNNIGNRCAMIRFDLQLHTDVFFFLLLI